MAKLFAVKPFSALRNEAVEEGEHTLKRSLGPVNLITLGIGAIVGAGIFVLTGQAAALYAGPAVALSFIVAGITCAFAGLCYAEFASVIPIAGSAYTYGYATLGELVAWIIGWDLVLEYGFGAATVASGWSGYVMSFLEQVGLTPSPALARWTTTWGNTLYFIHGQWVSATALVSGASTAGLPHVTGSFVLIAFVAILAVTAVLVIGIKESANLNSAIVFVKLSVIGVFLVLGIGFLLHHPHLAKMNWHPFIPPSDGHGHFGIQGIVAGASSVFFAYIGFDAVSTAAQEARNPQKDMPIGILGSLIICTVLYIIVSGLLTGIKPYTSLNTPAPVADGAAAIGAGWGVFMVDVGAIAGLASVMLVMILGQTRVLYTMAKDGLLPSWVSDIHPRFRTPWLVTIAVGILVAFLAAFFKIAFLGELVSLGTLLAFTIVCLGVWVMRVRQPDHPRPFRTPWVPFVPIAGMLISASLMVSTDLPAKIGFGIWLVVGLAIYFGYSTRHSKVQRSLKAEPAAASTGQD